jgi:pimeloyl-ACP methyl ester carboxylesterase
MTTRLLTMPRLGETMEEGTIVGWLIRPGETFRRGAPMLEVETDKTVVEYPALGDGVLEEILVKEGDRVSVGAPIARVTVSGSGDWEDEAAREPTSTPVEVTNAAARSTPAPATSKAVRPRATPPARHLAKNAGIALQDIPGTGRRGRIERRDVEKIVGAAPTARQSGAAGRIAFETVGQSKAAFLLIHGFAGERSAWAATASGLARAGWRVVLPDLPSHGETEAEAATLEELVALVSDFAAAIDGPVHLVGHSLGAAVAVGVADRLAQGAASLTLIAPAGLGREINADFVHGMAGATTAAEVAHLLRLLGPKGGEISDDLLAGMAAELRRGRLKPLAEALAAPQGSQRIEILRSLGALPASLPVQALFGTEDRIIPPSHAFNLPSRVAVHFLRAGHMPQWDAQREVLDLLNGGSNG